MMDRYFGILLPMKLQAPMVIFGEFITGLGFSEMNAYLILFILAIIGAVIGFVIGGRYDGASTPPQQAS
jgi:hypothetical protein